MPDEFYLPLPPTTTVDDFGMPTTPATKLPMHPEDRAVGGPVRCALCYGSGCHECYQGVRQFCGTNWRPWPAAHYAKNLKKDLKPGAVMDRGGKFDPDQVYSVEQVKAAYWKRVINGFDKFHGCDFTRLVGKANLQQSRGGDDWDNTVDIWVPKSVDEDFNLVLSLCTDGMHRQTTDWDQPTVTHDDPTTLIVPSTSNWHILGQRGEKFSSVLKKAGNTAYEQRSQSKGFMSVRPPWISKGGFEVRAFSKATFAGFDPEDFDQPVPVDDGLTGWDDLGW